MRDGSRRVLKCDRCVKELRGKMVFILAGCIGHKFCDDCALVVLKKAKAKSSES